MYGLVWTEFKFKTNRMFIIYYRHQPRNKFYLTEFVKNWILYYFVLKKLLCVKRVYFAKHYRNVSRKIMYGIYYCIHTFK